MSQTSTIFTIPTTLKTLVIFTIIATIFIIFSNTAHAQEQPRLVPGTYVEGEIIIKYQDGSTPTDIQSNVDRRALRSATILGKLQNAQEDAALALKGEETPEESLDRINAIHRRFDVTDPEQIQTTTNTYLYSIGSPDPGSTDPVDSFEDPTELINAYDAISIEFIQPNYIYSITKEPNDPNYSKQWGFEKINAPSAWDETTGSQTVKVAVIDTGIEKAHPDLSANVVKSVPIISGCVRDNDLHGHGTHVAGIIGAVTDNNLGVAGTNWDVSLYGYCVLDAYGFGTSASLTGGLNSAINDNVDIINMSLSGPSLPGQDKLMEDAIQKAYNRGIAISAAAGNCGQFSPGYYPSNPECLWGGDANYYMPGADPNTINVAATGPSDERAKYSNYGTSVDFTAPGGNPPSGSRTCRTNGADCIYSTWNSTSICPPEGVNKRYCSIAGTSMSAPFVSGALALLKATYPDITRAQMKTILVDTAIDLGARGKDTYYGHGKINLYEAVLAAAEFNPVTEAPTATPTLAPITETVTPTDKPFEHPCIELARFGDYDCSGEVNLADFEAWRRDFENGNSTILEFEWFREKYTSL